VYISLYFYLGCVLVVAPRCMNINFTIDSWQRCQSGLKSGVVDPGQQNFGFSGKFLRNFDFFRQFHKNLQFSQANVWKNSIFQANFWNISNFAGKFKKSIDFSRQKLLIYSNFWANYSTSLQKSPLSNILPVHDIISRPVHDTPRPPTQNLGLTRTPASIYQDW